jgi:hypothetical protein
MGTEESMNCSCKNPPLDYSTGKCIHSRIVSKGVEEKAIEMGYGTFEEQVCTLAEKTAAELRHYSKDKNSHTYKSLLSTYMAYLNVLQVFNGDLMVGGYYDGPGDLSIE